GQAEDQLRSARENGRAHARRDGALPARRHAAPGKHGGPRPCVGLLLVLRRFLEQHLPQILDHAVKELCRLYVSRSVTCEYCGNQRSVKATTSGALIEDQVLDLLNFEKS